LARLRLLIFLEQLFAKLRKQGLVSSSRGPGGGYRLSRSATEITVLDVISAVDEKVDSTQCQGKHNCHVDEKVDSTQCQGKHNCHADEKCVSHELWQSLSDQIRVYLAGITLHHVISDYQRNRNNNEKVIKFDAF